MANIRIKDLPLDGAPKSDDQVPIDLGTTRRTTVEDFVFAGRPTATKTEAETGTDPKKAMTPLTVKQAIDAQTGTRYVPVTRRVDSGTGLSGGQELTGDVTLSLNSSSVASLAKADSAVQSVNGKSGNSVTITPADVGAAPSSIVADVNANTAERHSHTNKAILDATTASFLAAEKTKLAGIAAGAQVNTVTSVAGKTGAVSLVKADVGLGNVDNTSDLNKPISTATQGALDGKYDVPAGTTAQYIRGDGSLSTFPSIPQGTVTSVGLTVPTGLSASGSPVTSSGTIAVSYATGYQGYTSAEASKLSGIAAGAQVNTVNSVNTKTGAVVLGASDVGAATSSQGAKADTALQAPGGTTGQILAKNSNTTNDVAWVSSEAATAVSYAAQTLNDAQKSQARANIDADKVYNSVSDVQSTTINSSVVAIRTNGYSSAGDGGGALYKRVTVEPAHAGKVQSADGAWWELSEGEIRVEMFGSDGAAFDAALSAARAVGVARGTGPAAVYLFDGDYYPAGGFDVSDSLIYQAPGSKLYNNTTYGWTQRIDTLPPNFNEFTLDPVHLIRYFDAQVKDNADPTKTNGLLKAGAPITAATVFGSRSAAIGTPLSIRATMEVHDVGTPDIGWNEIGGIYNHIIVRGDKTQMPGKYSIWSHDTIAMSGRNRPKWMGASFRYHNMSNANPAGGTGFGEGLSGISVMQRPLYADDAAYSGYAPTDAVYPMAAGITVSGYGGPQTATNGTHADALHAFYDGIHVGGSNSPYLGETSRSKLMNGIVIEDYTLQGLLITNPHPSFNPAAGSGAAIAIAGSAGIVNVGVSAPTQNAKVHVAGAADGNMKLYALDGSLSAFINFDGRGVLGTDLGKTNANNFGYYHAASGRYGFVINPQGHFTLPAIPTSASGLASGAIWSNAGVLNIVP